eukprot:scpid106009/ scgid20538/ 
MSQSPAAWETQANKQTRAPLLHKLTNTRTDKITEMTSAEGEEEKDSLELCNRTRCLCFQLLTFLSGRVGKPSTTLYMQTEREEYNKHHLVLGNRTQIGFKHEYVYCKRWGACMCGHRPWVLESRTQTG